MRYTSLKLANTARSGFVIVLLTLAATSNALTPSLASAHPKAGSQSEAAEHIAKATAAFQNDDYVEAKKEATKAIDGASNPSSEDLARASLILAKIAWSEGDRLSALDWIEVALKHADTVELHSMVASIYLTEGKVSQGLSELDLVTTKDPSNATAYELKGGIAWFRDELDDAILAFQKSLAYTAPSDPNFSPRQARLEMAREVALRRSEYKEAGFARPLLRNRLGAGPQYTEDARKHRISGAVSLVCFVDEQGTVGKVVVMKGLGYGLDDEAIALVNRWDFAPATKNGLPVKTWVKANIEFAIR